MPYKFTTEDCSKGGKAAAARPEFRDIQLKGRDTTVERHGRQFLVYIVRRWKGQKDRAGE